MGERPMFARIGGPALSDADSLSTGAHLMDDPPFVGTPVGLGKYPTISPLADLHEPLSPDLQAPTCESL